MISGSSNTSVSLYMYIQRPLAMDNNFEIEAVFSDSQFCSESHPVNLHQRKVVEPPALSFYAYWSKNGPSSFKPDM